MKLSIITINYNDIIGLQKTAKSVLGQTFRDFEWIIIDGGSTDGSKEFIQSLTCNASTSNPISYWCSEADNGIYNAMNKGIVKAKGEYLNFLNSGDAYHDTDVLESVFARDIPIYADVLYGNYYDIYENGNVIPQKLPVILDFAFLMRRPINHQSTFIKRILFENELYDESYKIVADGKAFMKWMLQGAKYFHLNIFVADFAMGGIHNQHADTIAIERKRIIQETVPTAIRVVAEQLNEERQVWNDYPYVKYALEIYKYNRIKRKFLTILIKILR